MAMTRKKMDKAFFLAAKKNDLGKVKELCGKGADLAVKDDDDGWRPLHWAAWHGNLPMVEFLVDAGADIASGDNWDEQPLHKAAWMGHEPVVKFLLEHGSDPAAAAEDGDTPMDCATKRKNLPVLALLERWNAPEMREKLRREGYAETVRDHWRRIAGHLPSSPRPAL